QFQDILEHDPQNKMDALVRAMTLGGFPSADTIPARAFSKMAMTLLEFDDVDALVDELFPDGENTPPTGQFDKPLAVAPGGNVPGQPVRTAPPAVGPGAAPQALPAKVK